MNAPEDGVLEKWSERHFGELALWRTVGQGVNIILSTIVIAKIFLWIYCDSSKDHMTSKS